MPANKSLKLSLAARAVGKIGQSLLSVASIVPGGDAIKGTRGTQVPVDTTRWFAQKVLGINGEAYWPMHPSSTVTFAKRVKIGIETSPGHSPGCMIHGVNGISIGDYTQISQNVALLSGNHDPLELRKQIVAQPILIGRYCLLGFGVVILPEVELGDFTIVAANSVVRHSFPEGRVVLAGAPAKVVRKLSADEAPKYRSPQEYNGYIRADRFESFCNTYLDLPDCIK